MMKMNPEHQIIVSQAWNIEQVSILLNDSAYPICLVNLGFILPMTIRSMVEIFVIYWWGFIKRSLCS